MNLERLQELAGVELNEAVPIEMNEQVRERMIEVLELAADTISRRDEVTDKTIDFTLNSIETVLGLLDPSNL